MWCLSMSVSYGYIIRNISCTRSSTYWHELPEHAWTEILGVTVGVAGNFRIPRHRINLGLR